MAEKSLFFTILLVLLIGFGLITLVLIGWPLVAWIGATFFLE